MADRHFGNIPGVPVSTVFASRRALKDAGLHSQLMALVSLQRAPMLSCYQKSTKMTKIGALTVIYTGQRGRDPGTGKQVADQELTRGNRGLGISRNKGLPVRIIRKVNEQYRYDGLYRVADAWHEKGKSGFRVWRFHIVALEPDDIEVDKNRWTVGPGR